MMGDLRPQHVTSSLRVMLPAYVVHATVFGLLYLVDPYDRVSASPSLEVILSLAPLPLWGVFLLALAAMQTWALVTHSRLGGRFALVIYGVTNILWGVGHGLAVAVNPLASPGAAVQCLFVAVCCFASAVSLRRGDRG